MPIAAIDVHSPTTKCKTRQVRLWRGIGFRLLSARYGDRLGRRLGTDHIWSTQPYVTATSSWVAW